MMIGTGTWHLRIFIVSDPYPYWFRIQWPSGSVFEKTKIEPLVYWKFR